jgi:huntingtin-interacting protein 1-related protein
LNLLAKLEAFQKLIFGNFRASANNEARISALVPLVEESFGIYQFIVSMMTAMYQIIGSIEVLGPLRDGFNKGHYNLVAFYGDCSSLKYLTSLVAVPKLSSEPPNFLSQGQPTKQPKNSKKEDNVFICNAVTEGARA